METKTIIEKLAREDLVNLLCTATYGSYWLECNAPDREGLDITEQDCLEDVWAKALLAGKKIECIDHYAEEEMYGPLGDHLDEDGNGVYLVSLQDILDGLAKCADGTFKVAASNYNNYGESEKRWLRECYVHFTTDESLEMDQPEAEALMQVIMFGELIYG